MVIGATKFLWKITSTTGLSSRFGYKLHVPIPDLIGRQQIIGMILESLRICHTLDEDDLRDLSVAANSMTGADIRLAVQKLRKTRIQLLLKSVHFKPVSNLAQSYQRATNLRQADIHGKRKYVPCDKSDDGAITLETPTQKRSHILHYGTVCKAELQKYLEEQECTVPPRVANLYQKYEEGEEIDDELRALGMA
jgi:SpoVK/Ycf46/Vps4 family AAA+-type ATPase